MSILMLSPPPATDTSPAGSLFYRWAFNIYRRLFTGINAIMHKNGSDQIINNNSETQLTWATVASDSLGGFDTTNNYYVCKEPGIYQINVQAKLNATLATGKAFTLRLYQNSNVIAERIVSNIDIDTPDLMISTVSSLAKFDTVYVKVLHTVGASSTIEGDTKSTFFNLFRIS